MRIAIFGATSQIAKDLILSFSNETYYDWVLYARRPDIVDLWLTKNLLYKRYESASFSDFSASQNFDAILNFVGVGNPDRAAAMGNSILSITLEFDEMVLKYLQDHPDCRYFFLSSGAAYGGNFSEPVDKNSSAKISINNLLPQDWYGIAKLYAECRHRALLDLPIIDIRVFSYFSSTQDISARYFISDCLRSIKSGTTLPTSRDNIVRDYLGAGDFFHLIQALLSAPPTNDVVDCYTQAPIDKFSLLEELKNSYGLTYEISTKTDISINATGVKINYFSNNFKASQFGYVPRWDSLQTVLNGISTFL